MMIKKKTMLKIIETLGYYANPETYFAISFLNDPPCGDFIHDFSNTKLGKKPGKKARNCLFILQKEFKENKI